MTYLDKILVKTYNNSSEEEKKDMIKAGGSAFLNVLNDDNH